MIETMEQRSRPVRDEIVIRIDFVDGGTYTQPMPIERAGDVQEFMDWFRRPGRDRVFAFHTTSKAIIMMLHHSRITAVKIEGYVEPDGGRSSRWYERLLDKLRSWWWLRHV